VAGVAHAATSAGHPATSAGHPAPAATTPAPKPTPTPKPTTDKVLTTTTAGVHVRTQPNTGRGSHIAATLGKAGIRITVSCYVTGQSVGGDRIWYRTVKPARDYVTGKYLHTGHEPAPGVPHC
jgi:hypothetical protein